MIISEFLIVRPKYIKKQTELLSWIQSMQKKASLNPLTAEQFDKIKIGTQSIEERGTILSDCLHLDTSKMEVFDLKQHEKGKTIDDRLKLYAAEAEAVFKIIYEQKPLPDHLIHVTCTGYIAPSPAQIIVAKKAPNATQVTHSYHMGCYGAFPAMRIARGFLTHADTCDIVHTEFCSLHFDPSQTSLEQLVIFSLFGDGSIRYRLTKDGMGLKVLSLHEELIPDSLSSMTWLPSTHGMQMTISKDVPAKIGRQIEKTIRKVFEQNQLDFDALRSEVLFAIHPGGPKIIDLIAQRLNLKKEQYKHSVSILRQYGNMSSATIPHILESILNDNQISSTTLIVSMAFGPGLTASIGLFQKVTE